MNTTRNGLLRLSNDNISEKDASSIIGRKLRLTDFSDGGFLVDKGGSI